MIGRGPLGQFFPEDVFAIASQTWHLAHLAIGSSSARRLHIRPTGELRTDSWVKVKVLPSPNRECSSVAG